MAVFAHEAIGAGANKILFTQPVHLMITPTIMSIAMFFINFLRNWHYNRPHCDSLHREWTGN